MNLHFITNEKLSSEKIFNTDLYQITAFSNYKLSEAIRRDIIETFNKKGIRIKKINVDVRKGSLNLSLKICE